MKLNRLALLGVALMSFGATFSATALPLKPFPASPSFSFDPGEDGDIPACGQILERLQRLQKITEESQLSVIGFMEESAGVVQGWHDVLSPLEGGSAPIEVGTFSPLAEGAAQINDVAQLAYQNADYVILELQKVTQALTKCEGASLGLSKNK